MELLPSQDDVLQLLRDTGGLRAGHFEYPNGMHVSQYLQVPLTMRSYTAAKTLSVGLSRLVRANPEIRAIIADLSIVAPATGGLPVAYGVCEALRAKQVYWSERYEGDGIRFRQFLEVQPGEKILLVDDILRSGHNLTELRRLVESRGGEVVAVAVMIFTPHPNVRLFEPLPFYYLAKLDQPYYPGAASCELCKRGVPLEKVWV
jgi:orotate phosphoribosyltransferase